MLERERRWEDLFKAISESGTRRTEELMDSASETSDSIQEKVQRFRIMDKEEDPTDYFSAFEAHMITYRVDREQWTKYLVPILRPEASQVYLSMLEEAKLNYSRTKTANLVQYKETKGTYKQKLDGLKRKNGENWGTVVHRDKQLYLEWIEGCSAIEDIVALGTLHLLVKMMPKQLALHVMDRDPKTCQEASEIAD